MNDELLLGKTKIYMVAAGSGGHIIPAQSIARDLKKNDQNRSIIWCTGVRAIENQLVKKSDQDIIWRFKYQSVPGRKLWKYPYFFISNLVIFIHVFFKLLRNRKESAIVSTGGLLSIPISLAASILQIPIILVELNAVFGKTIKFLLPFATKVCTVFELEVASCYQKKVELIEYPLRTFSVEPFVKEASLNQEKPKIKIALFGGSQGSEELNHLFLKWLIQNKESADRLYIYHFYGNDRTIDFEQWYQKNGFQGVVTPWTNSPEVVYQKADFVISRAGSGALHELLFFKKKSFIYPLRSISNDHQFLNAKMMAKKAPNLFSLIEKNNFDELKSLLEG